MGTMNLGGPYRLTFDDVSALIRGRAPGVFALGYSDAKGIFYVNYVGRSDSDVRARLLDFIGSAVAFKFEISISAKAAFLRECEVFHSFRPRSNVLHPSRPRLSDWRCPRCGLLEDL